MDVVAIGTVVDVARGRLQGKPVARLNTGVLTRQAGGGIEVVSSIAYIAGGMGLGLVDVSDPTNPTNLKKVDTGVLSHEGAGTVVVRGATAFVAGGLGLAVVDVSVPTAAKRIAKLDTGVLCHNSGGHVLVDSSDASKGDLLYVTGGLGVAVVDASNPLKPARLAKVDTGVLSHDGSGHSALAGNACMPSCNVDAPA